MATRKTCDKCEHYTPETMACAKMGDTNDAPCPDDGAVGWDHEGYRAGVYVGPKFGCIHWLKKVAK